MDIGTGTRTVLAMILAEDFGVEVGQVELKIGGTRWPIGPSSGGSKTLVGITPAVRQAAHEVKGKLFVSVARSSASRPRRCADAGAWRAPPTRASR